MWKLCGEELAAKARDSGYTNDLSPPTRHGVRFPRCQCTSLQLCTVCVVTCGEPSSSPNCVCAGRRSRPTTIFLSVLHWRVTLNLLLIIRLLNLLPDLSSLCRFRDDTGWGLAVDTATLVLTSGVAAHS